MSDIRIDHPGDGEWIMKRLDGTFNAACYHSIAMHRNGCIAGGFVVGDYLGASVAVHMAGDGARWCSRELMWMVFHYAFRQLGCSKVLAPVASDNWRALELDLRAGFRLEAIVRDALAPGRHLMVLSMGLADCRWLDYTPQQYFPGAVARRVGRDG